MFKHITIFMHTVFLDPIDFPSYHEVGYLYYSILQLQLSFPNHKYAFESKRKAIDQLKTYLTFFDDTVYFTY